MLMNNPNIESVYTTTVMGKISCHAQAVAAVFPALYGYAKAYATKVEVLERKGDMKNMAWATFPSGRRISFSHKDGKILAKDGSVKGPVLCEFDNSTTLGDLLKFFSSL